MMACSQSSRPPKADERAASTLREALRSDREVRVDLGKLEFLDSTGVAMLVVAIGEGGERLSFLPSEHDAVNRILSLTGLDERMNLASAAIIPAVSADVDTQTLQPAA